MSKAYRLIFLLSFIAERVITALPECANPPTKSMIMTAAIVDVYGGSNAPVVFDTSDDSVVFASLTNDCFARIVKLNHNGKLVWSATGAFGGECPVGTIIGMENLYAPYRNTLLFFINFKASSNYYYVYFLKCDLATCKKNALMKTIFMNQEEIALTSWFTSSTGNIYAAGFKKKNGYPNGLIMKYDPSKDSFQEVQYEYSNTNNVIVSSIVRDASGKLIFAGIKDNTNIFISKYTDGLFTVSEQSGLIAMPGSINSLDIFIFNNILYTITPGGLYSISSDYGSISSLITDTSIQKAALTSLDGNSIVFGQYNNDISMARNYVKTDNCVAQIKDNSLLNKIKITSIAINRLANAYFFAGVSTINVANYVIAKIQDTTALSCGAQISFYNNECITELTSGCHPACSKCLKPNDINACTEPNSASIILYSARSNQKNKIIKDDGSDATVILYNCDTLCGGTCTETQNPSKCAYYCTHYTEYIDETYSGINKCSCQAGYITGKYQPGCISTVGCSDLCENNECPADQSLCFECKSIPYMRSIKNGIYYNCICDKRTDSQGYTACLRKSPDCHAFCDGTCIKNVDKTSCGKCRPNLHLIDLKNGNLASCDCQPPYISYNGVCILDSNCAKECSGKCTEAQDNTKCFEQCNPNIQLTISKENGDGTFTCISELMDVKIVTKTEINSMDRCKGIELEAAVTPSV